MPRLVADLQWDRESQRLLKEIIRAGEIYRSSPHLFVRAPASQSSHSPSEQASQTSASLSYHGKTLESATDWADAVRTALVKDSKGYPDRLSGYLTSTRAIAELAGTYSLRLASFFYQELVHAAATLGRKNADYTEQLRILYYPEEPLPDYLHYVACTRELISIEEEIVREQRNCIQRRILALTRVLRSGESRRRSMHYLMEKLMPFLYLPDGYASECNRDRRSSVSNPMIIRGAVEYISASSPASSSADSVPPDHSHEEYIDWLSNGCPDSDTEYSPDSD